MSTGVSCLVFVEGERAADGSPGERPTQPAILEDLKVSWGRSDTMSQPAPDTCTFSVLDPEGGEAFIGLYRTGTRVDVMAQGTIYPVAATATFANPGFETTAITWAVTGGTAARTAARVHSGAQALAVKPTAAPVTLWLGPGAFQPAGTNPDAWDLIPTAQAGQLWTLRAALWLPMGASATVRPALFNGPYSSAGVTAGSAVVVPGQGGWVELSPEFLAESDGQWVGLHIVFNPVGLAWDETPPALTWNAVEATLTWDDMGTMYVDDVDAIAPAGSSTKGVLVFSGRVTDLSASWDSSAGGVIAEVTAVGFTADLDNRLVGDEPWPVESIDARSERILTLAALPITIDIDSPMDATLMSWRDVDSQGATGLLQELAVSVDGVLWSAVHQSIGAYLRLEDPALREALLKLSELRGPAPVVLRTNLASNPSVEVGLTNWTSYSTATGSRSNEWASAGSWSRKIVKTLVGNQGSIYLEPAAAVGVVPGNTITVGVTLMAPAGGVVSVAPRCAYVGTPSTQESGNFGNATVKTVTLLPGVPMRVSTTYTIMALQPTQTALATVGLQVTQNGAAVGWALYADAVTIEKGATDGTPFDGDTPDTASINYAWLGAAHASTSTQSTVQTLTIVIIGADPTTGFDLSACVILRDPVTWVQDVSDVVTRVAVTWKVQGVDDEGNPTTTEATVREIDPALETRYGTRNASVSTQLQAAIDAQQVASKVLARATPSGWRASGIAIDDDYVTGSTDGVNLMLDLLDGTSRIGAPIVITDLPGWSPAGSAAGVYLEGGTYRYIGGRWVLELLVSAAGSGLGESAQWDQLDPDWLWNQWDPALTWNDLRGVGAP